MIIKEDRTLKESVLELTEDVKTKIEESRKRPTSEFKSQEEIEKNFLLIMK